MARNECDGCGLAACDLPDGVDPDLIFEGDGKGNVYCQGCQSQQPVEESDGGTKKEPTYLGDGVNAAFDGYYIRLTVDHGPGVALDPETYRSLVRFAEASGFGGEG